ncbi:MAG: hypothetical protein HY078_15480 [Elusimicrobia bacterium]|nr:hypothetical protein [Elusimicrobiota bacterium]
MRFLLGLLLLSASIANADVTGLSDEETAYLNSQNINTAMLNQSTVLALARELRNNPGRLPSAYRQLPTLSTLYASLASADRIRQTPQMSRDLKLLEQVLRPEKFAELRLKIGQVGDVAVRRPEFDADRDRAANDRGRNGNGKQIQLASLGGPKPPSAAARKKPQVSQNDPIWDDFVTGLCQDYPDAVGCR